jgi:hypothetical protein
MTKRLLREVEKYKILETRICDLDLKFDNHILKLIRKVSSELRNKGIRFRPEYYYGTGWGCVDGSVSIEIPFWFGSSVLRELEAELNFGGIENESEVLMGLRHEIGHAINYAYRLYKDREWQRNFGNFKKVYRDYYIYNPWSKRHVRHLPEHYAQKHPDEDWAETFAVWLTPRSNWRWVYSKTPAIKKLEYVDEIMAEIAKKDPPNRKTDRDDPIERVRMTVAEYYKVNLESRVDSDDLYGYVDDIKAIFNYNGRRTGGYRDAWKFIHKFSPVLEDKVGSWIYYADREKIKKHLSQIEGVCRTYKLKVRPGDEAEKLSEVSVLLTYNIMYDIYT